jgi:hypothetical protein
VQLCCRNITQFSHEQIIFTGTVLSSVMTVFGGNLTYRLVHRTSYREHFKKLKILPLQSQYILSLLFFVVDNGEYFKVNSEIHIINTRNKLNLHLPISNLSVYQKGTYQSGIKVFNSLPSQIKDLSHNRNQFKCALKKFLVLAFILYFG